MLRINTYHKTECLHAAGVGNRLCELGEDYHATPHYIRLSSLAVKALGFNSRCRATTLSKLIAAPQGVAMVTAGLVESNGSPSSGL